MTESFDYSSWPGAELDRAANTASQFLSEKHPDISRAFERQCDVLCRLVAILNQPDLTVEQRLDCFARIAETSEGIRECADGFFELGSEPMVARVLSNAEFR